jgi:hypothetical protein
MKRWLQRFWPRLVKQLNVTAGIAGLAALVLTIAGLIVPGVARITLIATGIAIAAVTLIVGIVRAFPPALRDPAAVLGQELEVADLGNLDPPVPAVGLIGDRGVGKTTLKGRLLQLPQETPITERVTARVGVVINNPPTYIAILDGRGISLYDQFKVAESSDIVVVLFDHNDIDKIHPNEDRMKQHVNFGVQLRDDLKANPKPGRRIHILLNKRDRWELASGEQQKELRDFFDTEVSRWRDAFDEVTCAYHSNDITMDTIALVQQIGEHWDRCQQIRAARAHG